MVSDARSGKTAALSHSICPLPFSSPPTDPLLLRVDALSPSGRSHPLPFPPPFTFRRTLTHWPPPSSSSLTPVLTLWLSVIAPWTSRTQLAAWTPPAPPSSARAGPGEGGHVSSSHGGGGGAGYAQQGGGAAGAVSEQHGPGWGHAVHHAVQKKPSLVRQMLFNAIF